MRQLESIGKVGLNLLGTATLSNDEHLFVTLVVPVWQHLSSMTALHFTHNFMYEAEKIILIKSSNDAKCWTQAFFPLISSFPNFLALFLSVPGLFGSDVLHSWGDCWVASQPTGKATRVSKDKFPPFCAEYGGVKTEQMLLHPPCREL